MQQTSALYRRLLAEENHWFETSVVIGEGGSLITEANERILFGGTGIVVSRDSPESGYLEGMLFSVSTHSRMMDNKPEIGRCISQELEVKMINPAGDLPRMSQVVVYVRVCTEDEQSEWLQQGEFFIDTREVTHNKDGLNILTIHAYDAMLKANQDYAESTLSWPAVTTDVVREIARQMVVDIDSRTWNVMNVGYTIQWRDSYKLIDYLGFIGSMYLGNWIITETGELRLVGLLEMPKETRYLTDHIGDRLMFGGTRILV